MFIWWQGVDLESHKDNSCSSHEGDDDEEGGTGGSGGRDSPENFSGDKPEAALSGGGTLVGNLKVEAGVAETSDHDG